MSIASESNEWEVYGDPESSGAYVSLRSAWGGMSVHTSSVIVDFGDHSRLGVMSFQVSPEEAALAFEKTIDAAKHFCDPPTVDEFRALLDVGIRRFSALVSAREKAVAER